MKAPLFAGGGLTAHAFTAGDMPRLQAFYEANPQYFLTINGRPPPPDLARLEFEEQPPPHLPHGQRWFAGLHDDAGALQGVVEYVCDFIVARVWHLGLLVIATRLHGAGVAQAVHAAWQAHAQAGGAEYLRLGVVQGNVRAQRFWTRLGYQPLRLREGVDTGGRLNAVRVMVKPLGGRSLETYLEAVARDRPDSTLP